MIKIVVVVVVVVVVVLVVLAVVVVVVVCGSLAVLQRVSKREAQEIGPRCGPK